MTTLTRTIGDDVPPQQSTLSDVALIERTRGGDRAAFGELWQRHAASARTVARSYSSLDPDDLVAESFTKIYDAILAGGGPTAAFRPYLFTTLRNTAASWGRARREVNLETLESFEDPATSESATLDALDRSTTAQAFRSLPSRWQEVLWYSEVEGMPPARIAPLVGMSANATAALAYRAREGLRQAWIQAHLRNPDNEPECRWTIERLAAYTRDKLRTRETGRLEQHLDECAKCTIVAAEAREVGSRLALVLLPLAAGISGATAYSGWLAHGAPGVDVALGAAGVPSWAAAGAPRASDGAGASAGPGGSASSGTAASTGSAASTAGLSAAGIAVGATIGGLVLAAAAVAAVIVVPTLAATSEAAPSTASSAEAPVDAPVDAPLEFPAPVLPEAIPPAAVAPPVPDAPVAAPPRVAPSAPPPLPAPAAEPQPQPGPEPRPTPEPVPGDTVALPVAFTVDSAGGLVDPVLAGTAEPGALVVVTASDGRTWRATAQRTGAWSVLAADSVAGATTYTAVQTDAAGNTSAPSAPRTVVLTPPSLVVSTYDGSIGWGWFDGEPEAIVQVLVEGVPLGTVQLDDAGRYDRWLGPFAPVSQVGVRYLADDGRTGPTAAATSWG